MFRIFKKKSEKEILRRKYEQLMEESHKLSTTNRRMSDAKLYEADLLMKDLEAM